MADAHLCSYELEVSPSDRLMGCLIGALNSFDLKEDEVTYGNQSMEDIRRLAQYLREHQKRLPHLHELLLDSQVLLPKPPVPERNPELEARVQMLKAEQQAKEYAEMTKGVDATYRHKHANEFRQEVKTLRSHMAASVNFVVTVGACFFFGYTAVRYTFPHVNLAGQFFAGLVAGGIGGLADLYFLAKQLDAAP